MWSVVHDRKAGFYTNIPINCETKHLFRVLMEFNMSGTVKTHFYLNVTFATLTIINVVNYRYSQLYCRLVR